MHRKQSVAAPWRGLTLVEALVVLAIVAIVATLAIPPFVDHLRRGHRLEAIAELEAVRLAQERYRALNHRYAAGLTELGRAADEVEVGRYRVSLEAVPDPGLAFRAVARPVAGSDQARDPCGRLVLTEAGPDPGAPGCWPR